MVSRIKVFEGDDKPDYLKVDLKKRSIRGSFTVYRMKDSNTGQYIMYMPALEISGYGGTPEQADFLLRQNMNHFFEHYKHLTDEQIHFELIGLGWKRGWFKKEYSNLSINPEGCLEGYEVEGKVERLTVTAE